MDVKFCELNILRNSFRDEIRPVPIYFSSVKLSDFRDLSSTHFQSSGTALNGNASCVFIFFTGAFSRNYIQSIRLINFRKAATQESRTLRDKIPVPSLSEGWKFKPERLYGERVYYPPHFTTG